MESAAVSLVQRLVPQELTVRAMRKVAEEEGTELPPDDAPIVRLILKTIKEINNEPILDPHGT